MNYELFDDLINHINKKEIINDWLNNGYKNNILMINGNNGLFKSALSEYILKEHSIIKIDIENCKIRFNFEEYIKLSLEKISIESLLIYNNKKRIKGLIIDDLNYILKTDKKLFQSISNWILKMKDIKYPIICIVNNYENNKIQKLLKKKMKKIDIILFKDDFYYFTKKYFLDKDNYMNKYDIETLIYKSNYNFNSIKININYINKKDDINYINKFLITPKDNIYLLKNLINNYHKYDINDIIIKSMHDYNILSLNLIDNLLNITNDLEIIDDIYYQYLIYDNYYFNNNNYQIDILLIYIIIYPIYLLQGKKITKIEYNKYICKSIIYIKNNNIDNEKIIKIFNKLEKDIEINKDEYNKNEYNKNIINNVLNNYKFFKDTKLTKKIINKIFVDKNKI